MNKADMTEAIMVAKAAKNVPWQAIAEVVGRSDVWVTSACLGQNTMSAGEAQKVGDFLELALT